MSHTVSRGASSMCVLLFATAAAAAEPAAPTVGMLPPLVLGVSDPAQQAHIAAALVDGTQIALGVRMRALPLVASCDPSTESRCLALEIEKVPAIAVAAQLSMERGAHAWILRLRVFGRDGQRVDERRTTSDEDDAARAAQELLLGAFDPARHTGRVTVRGLAPGARATIDGKPHDGDAGAATAGADSIDIEGVAVGRHVVEVSVDGATRSFPIDVELDRTTEVLADPVLAAPAGAAGAAESLPSLARPVAVGGVVSGLTVVGGALVLWIVSAENRDEWRRRANGTTFPRNSDDPLCAETECRVDVGGSSGQQIGWTRGYGPLGESGQVGQGARLMMVAFSRENDLRWSTLNDYSTVVGVSAAAVTLASSVALLAFAMDGASTADAETASE